MELQRLSPAFFNDSTERVAQKLLGMLLVHQVADITLIGKIVETEAYTFGDPASHCYQKKSKRNKALFGPVAHAYVYKIYGIHYGFNVVAHNENDKAGGILIRALEPVEGMEHMQKFRPVEKSLLTNGPGKLTQAFNIDSRFYGHNLLESETLFLAEPSDKKTITICATPRIGISKAQEYKGRFIIKNNPWITPHQFNKKITTAF